MAIVPAKVIGEIVKGFITLELWPDRKTEASQDESSSTLADNIDKNLVPEELQVLEAAIWVATEKTAKDPRGYVQKVFPRDSEEYPQAYRDWLDEIARDQ